MMPLSEALVPPFYKGCAAVGSTMKLQSKIFYTYIAFVVVYLLLALLPTPDKTALTKYHLHATGARLLDFTLIIPTIVMWFAIFYGYGKLSRYGGLIGANQDGKQVAKLSKGLFVLAIGVPLISIISSALVLAARSHHGMTGASVIIPDYLNIVCALVAFFFINRGARGLNRISRSQPGFLTSHGVVLTVIIIGVIFCNLIARSHESLRTTYHMTYSLVMLTFAIPYMYIWFLGLFAIAEMYAYSKEVSGIIYRRAWNRLAIGLGAIIVIDILLQYLGTLSSWLMGLSLAKLLLLLYVLLLLLAGGFIVVALGSKELMKIEEA
jgi:hypothetical protein